MVAVVAVAYGTAAPELGIAEFAPTARSQLEAPPTTAGDGAGPSGGRGARRATTSTTTATPSSAEQGAASASSAPTSLVGRGRECFGNPPRQLPDPRSPACLATVFEGDNGGATSKGVSATEIRIAIDGAAPQPDAEALLEYFNRHFELYGRRLVPVYLPSSGVGTVTQQRAAAADIGAAGVFAALGAKQSYFFPAFYSELARQGVITVLNGGYELLSDRDLFDPLHPYVWSVFPSVDQVWTNLSSFICTSLAGRPASHAGGSLASSTRHFGIVVGGNYRMPRVQPLLDGLSGCDVSPTVVELQYNGDSTDWQNRARAGLQTLKDAGTTSVICACSEDRIFSLVSLTDDYGMDNVEWLLPTFNHQRYDEWYLQNTWPESLRGRTFGMTPMPKVAAAQTDWGMRAIQEINPKVVVGDGGGLVLYERLLVLAAGIQAAGPALTADTFGQGLMSAQFANAEAGRAPYWLPSVGFGPGDHSFYNDYALAWWSNTAEPLSAFVTPGRGSWCYLARGERYQAGHFPTDADSRFFSPNEPCR